MGPVRFSARGLWRHSRTSSVTPEGPLASLARDSGVTRTGLRCHSHGTLAPLESVLSDESESTHTKEDGRGDSEGKHDTNSARLL